MNCVERQMEILKKRTSHRVEKLESEIMKLRREQAEEEVIFGLGGSYRRKEKAIEKRQQEVDELLAFEKQIHKPILAEELTYSVLYCKSCHNEIFTRGRLVGEWHECPVCKKMIYGNSGKRKMRVIKET